MTNAEELQTGAWGQYQAGNRAEAERLCRSVLRVQPLHAGAVYLLGVLALDGRQPDLALLHFHHATLLQPDNAAFHNGLGEAYRARGDLKPAADCFRAALAVDPRYAAAHNALGLTLLDQGDVAGAIASFRQALAVRPDYERAHLNLGQALHRQGDLEAAGACYAEAIRLKPDYAIAHNNLGVVLQAQQRHGEAAACCREALRRQPDYPEAHFNLGNSLMALADPAAARASFGAALRLRPDYAKAHFGLGKAAEALGDMPAALAAFREAIRIQPDYADAHEGIGNVLLRQPDWEGALAALARAVALQPDKTEAFAWLAYGRLMVCDWRSRAADLERLWADADRALAEGKATPVVPFSALALPWTAAEHLAVARSYSEAAARSAEPQRQALNFAPRTPGPLAGGRLRIAYLAGEFRNHATSHLIQGLFGLHDRGAFEVFAYSFGADDGSSYRRRIAADCDQFIDLSDLSAADCARRIHGDGIHILVDLQGYAQYPRMVLLALRPAPIQVHYLGYPGTLGAEFVDYLIGDPVVTPPERAALFREKLVLLPHCYQVNDHQQPIATTAFTRSGQGLPQRGFVFCCFNNSYKIEPGIFDVWMRVLARVPGSVLWLLSTGAALEQNLRREAETRGVAGERLVFARPLPKAEHLARHRLADLFLDTYVYNAHTTASDALWAGVPLLTCMGETFASRVAASLLTAVGVPELIVANLEEYERRAVRLAEHPEELRPLRERLAANRTTWPLFDTPRFARNLERAYRAMWQLHAAGRPPELIVVAE
jgi:predicted O-linked N-acetylglucosamine transferase (SPINDLY family)